MLRVFSCPRPFRRHINIIQRDAIRSWTLLQPKPEIILTGGKEGTAEVWKEFALRHSPEVERNKYGTHLINALFAETEKMGPLPLMYYINADIVFMNDLMEAIHFITTQINFSFLLVGPR